MKLAAVIAIGLAIIGTATADARERNTKRIESALRSLDPETRLHQVCDMAAMQHIAKDKTYKPDRAVVDAVSEATISGDSMKGDGGAFRSRGKWYQFSFSCLTTSDRMSVQTFTHKIGPEIPESKYETYGLWE